MKDETFLRASEINKRIEELNKMQKRLEDKDESAWLRVNHYNEDVRLSDDMRTTLLGMCIGEKARLVKEFEEL